MANENNFDVIIIGGSYAGLSAAMALGRSLRNVLIIDSGKPCNRQTPHSHNFITQDGETPAAIAEKAKKQVLNYETVKFHTDIATTGVKTENGFEITTEKGDTFNGKRVLFATGIKDIMPEIDGFAECWGISVIHCPYCHGYEVRNEKTGLFANGDIGFEMAKLLSNWTKDLTLYTHGKSTLTAEQTYKLNQHNIQIVESEISHLDHKNGQLQNIVFKDNSKVTLKALYAKIPFIQHSDIPVSLGCELTEHGHLKVDNMQKTNIAGVFASGDNTFPMRSVAQAVYAGSFAGAVINKDLIESEF